MKILFRIMMLMVLFFGFVACGDEDNVTDETESFEAKYQKADLHAENVSPEFVAANTTLAAKLFDSLNIEGENLMISPLSVSIAMAMALNGATGDNFDEMKTVLEYDSMTMEDVNSSFYNLINSLVEADKDMVLSIADSAWMYDAFGESFNEEYVNLLKDKYIAEPYLLDFSSDTAVDTINNWVSDNTDGKIKYIIDKIPDLARMFLINAIYFNASWTVAFDDKKTWEGTFTKSDGDMITVEYMKHLDQKFEYRNPGTFRTIRLPYGRGKFSFYGIIPSMDRTIDDLTADIVENGVEEYLNNLSETEIGVVLPKFKFEYTNDLVKAFQSLGMEEAFNEGSFVNIGDFPEGLFIAEVIHKTFIEVSENGTEAAAVTEVEMDAGDSGVEPEGFFGTKPFVYIIRDDRSGTILFMGKVADPTVEK